MNNKFDNTKVKELDNSEYKINKKSIKINTKNKNPGIVIFYYYWCGYCNLIAPELLKLAEKKNLNIYAIHGENPLNKESFEFLKISGVPHIRFVKENGLISKQYMGNRTMKDLQEFIKKNKIKKEMKKEMKKVIGKKVVGKKVVSKK